MLRQYGNGAAETVVHTMQWRCRNGRDRLPKMQSRHAAEMPKCTTTGTYKPIEERLAYGQILLYANLSPIGLYVSRDEDSLEGSSL